MEEPDPLIGIWKLNIAKSNFWAFQQATMKEVTGAYRELGNDMIEVTATGTATDGSPVSLKGAFPRQGGGTITPEGMSYVVTVIDPYSFYLTILQNGKQVLMYHSTISKDGKTKRDQFKGMDTNGKAYEGVEVWDRQ
jgi:hypothetical protein